ncbi:DUF2726 domain-containing protein [Escherichia coli]|nr:DUF2726 domain-containing protein [Escherichia coli]
MTSAVWRRPQRHQRPRSSQTYLLCDKTDLKPLLAIELDDKSHQREDRIARDKLVDGIFKAVGLPVIHHPVKNTYSQSNLIMIISEAIYNRH